MQYASINYPLFKEEESVWFEKWFDSPYYHILYKNRNHKEARGFLDNLGKHFRFQESHHILDLACGKGRHAIYLNQLGPKVTGLDLSISNIVEARNFSSSSLSFEVHDMREPFGDLEFDFVLNLFTSFGYFENEDENSTVIENVSKALKHDGFLILDYLNPFYALNHLIPFEVKEIDGVSFQIRREVEKGFINKYIEVKDRRTTELFKERVKLIFPLEFKAYFSNAKMELTQIFGNYNMQPFDFKASPRMIMIGRKTA